ncbi:MAG TPA: hypothetical protein VN065_00090 [Bradyrhizobium sp.]|nr:hypothetical protein [Bradyrhizobium sp.]
MPFNRFDISITPQRRGVIAGGVLIICRRLCAAPRGLVAQVRGVFQACEIAHAQRHAVELYIFDGIANRADVNRMASAAEYQTLPRGVALAVNVSAELSAPSVHRDFHIAG